MDINAWARKWGVSHEAMMDFRLQAGMLAVPDYLVDEKHPETEAGVSNLVRINEFKLGNLYWRNNVGAGFSEDGQFMRWGLANDSEAMNKVIKSSDLIGIKKRLIVAADVGTYIGQFSAKEMKKPGWHYTGYGREVQQLAFGTRVMSLGGDFSFSTGY